jgi:hypothetical protein
MMRAGTLPLVLLHHVYFFERLIEDRFPMEVFKNAQRRVLKRRM